MRLGLVGLDNHGLDFAFVIQHHGPQSMSAGDKRIVSALGSPGATHGDRVEQPMFDNALGNRQGVVFLDCPQALRNHDLVDRDGFELGHQAASSMRAVSEARAAAAILQ